MRRTRRLLAVVLLGGVVTLAGATTAGAVAPEVQLSTSTSIAHPGETVTVTETITNVNGFTVLHPAARLFSTPQNLTSYTTLVSCSGVACSTVDGPDGPVGYQGTLPEALSAGEAAQVTFTLKITANAPDFTHTLQGQFFGSNYATERVAGPTLTVDARADRAIKLTGTPRPGLLGGRIDFTVSVTNNGPDPATSTAVTTSLPAGLKATAGAGCTPSAGTVACTVGELANGAKGTAAFSVPYGLLTIGLPFTFTANRSGAVPEDLNSANDKSSVTCTVLTPLLANCG
ncbi:DUF11 domain-containing protein [Amycolatopsis sp. 195334CR]|uniref:DUF11 domain-containing protein n=1 Tax=Amycolatopsis sp. 195334CR TaxID=2814588 RepID=UPI001A8F77F3|nr:DUF11 domain-containing protein [Amycolatopsis sp. 195334CR]MBN6037123.1 DUF11 domain-containing protein [Amycolatopsis sp. 195334CR]